MNDIFDDGDLRHDTKNEPTDFDETHLDKDAKLRLGQLVSRLESIGEEKKSLSVRASELLADAKAHGLDPKIVRAVLKRRTMSRDDLERFDTMVELYSGVFA